MNKIEFVDYKSVTKVIYWALAMSYRDEHLVSAIT